MFLKRETVIKALEGVLLIQDPTLWDDNGSPTDEHYMAIKSVHENLDQFQQIVQEELKKFPKTNEFLGHLISERLSQDEPLASPIIQKLFPFGPIELEDRLNRIIHVPNIETVSFGIHAPKARNQGYKTDDVIKDIWAEFFVADFIVSHLKVDRVEKVAKGDSQPAIDFYVWKDMEEWIVEVARIRNRDFQGETMPWGSQNCTKPENVFEIREALQFKFCKKNEQIKKFISLVGRDFDKRIVAIKTSQEEYQDCSYVIIQESKKLMKEKSYPEITQLLLIYDTETFEFVENLHARK